MAVYHKQGAKFTIQYTNFSLNIRDYILLKYEKVCMKEN